LKDHFFYWYSMNLKISYFFYGKIVDFIALCCKDYLHLHENLYLWKIISLMQSNHRWIYSFIGNARIHQGIYTHLFYIVRFFFHFLSLFCFENFVNTFSIHLSKILILVSFLSYLYYSFFFRHFLRFRKRLINDFHEAHRINFRDIIFRIILAFPTSKGINLFSLEIVFDLDIWIY
jgi:hypothetical protein